MHHYYKMQVLFIIAVSIMDKNEYFLKNEKKNNFIPQDQV